MDQKIDLDEIRALVEIASESEITELTVESPTLKVSIKRAPVGTPGVLGPAGRPEIPTANPLARAGTPAASPAAVGTGSASPEELAVAGAEIVPNHLKAITAPMVGTFYRAGSPEAPPFVQEGDAVETGQTVCIIEAMKLFNEIQSDVPGRVVRILSENGTPVEYGQTLFLIEPTS